MMPGKTKTGQDAVKMKSMRNLVLHGLYFSLYAFFKYLPFPFFNYFRYWVIKIFAPAIRTSYIMDGVTIFFPWRISIGKKTSLNQGVIVDGFGGVSIGETVRIAPYCVINSVDHVFVDPDVPIMDQGYTIGPVVIENDVWLGANVVVCKGVTIGRGSVIGAGSVVTQNIPPYSIAVGAPCRVVASRQQASQ